MQALNAVLQARSSSLPFVSPVPLCLSKQSALVPVKSSDFPDQQA